MNNIIDRKTLKATPLKVMKSQKFLYHTHLGRLILKSLIKPSFTIKQEKKLSSKKSLKKIPKFIKKNNIDTSIYELDNINSFNDFFSRKIKEDARIIDKDNNHLISPCDSKLQAYEINKDKIFEIKNSYYRINDLLKNDDLASYFDGGYALIFRLCVDDYHRYCYIDDGHKKENIHIVIRGLRAITDFEYELQIAQTNKELSHNMVDTVFLTTSIKYSYLSSSVVKEIASYNGDISPCVSDFVADALYQKYGFR